MFGFTVSIFTRKWFGLGPIEEDLLLGGAVVDGDHELARLGGFE